MLFLIPNFWSKSSPRSLSIYSVSAFCLGSLDRLVVLYIDILLSSQQLYPHTASQAYESLYHIPTEFESLSWAQEMDFIELEC